MRNEQREYWKSLAEASRLVSKKRLSLHRRENALDTLGSAFCDVELPAIPMELSDEERAEINGRAASEMRAAFRQAASDARRAPLGPTAHARLAAVVDGLWRELAVANWEIVGEQERLRVEMAGAVVMSLAQRFMHEQGDADNGVARAVLTGMHEQLSDNRSDLARMLRAPLGARGAGVHHARRALEEVLDATEQH